MRILCGKWRSLTLRGEQTSDLPLTADDDDAFDLSSKRIAAFIDIISLKRGVVNICRGNCVWELQIDELHEEYASERPLNTDDKDALDRYTGGTAAFVDVISWDCGMVANIPADTVWEMEIADAAREMQFSAPAQDRQQCGCRRLHRAQRSSG